MSGFEPPTILLRLQLSPFDRSGTQPLKNRQHNPVLAVSDKGAKGGTSLVAYFLAQENIHFIKRELNLDLRHIDFVIVHFSFAIVRSFFILTI